MTPRFLLTVVLALTVLPTFAQIPVKPLTPPDVLGTAKTIQFTATLFHGPKAMEVSKAILALPNKAYVVDTDAKTEAIDVVYASDGKTQTEYRPAHGHYTKSDAPSQIADVLTSTLAISALKDFFAPTMFAKYRRKGNLYAMPLPAFNGPPASEWLRLDPGTGLPNYIEVKPDKTVSSTSTSRNMVDRVEFTNWKLNAPVDDSKFAYTPPADAKLYVTPKLLADGTTAPDFTVQDKDGKAVKLSDYRGKTVVLDFWATWCGPCQSSLPHTTAVAKKYALKNVIVLAVNVWDTPQAFHAWLPKHPEYAPLNFAVDTNADQDKSVATALYGVSGIPTQYVINAQGKIVKSIVGYEPSDTQLEDTLRAVQE